MFETPTFSRTAWPVFFALALIACDDSTPPDEEPVLAEGIFAAMGEPLPTATDAQRATFADGEAIVLRRFTPEEGLGPLYNVTFCGACHEGPVTGGSAPRYRDFFLGGTLLGDGTFIEGGHGGVVPSFDLTNGPSRPEVNAQDNVIARRSAIPFFGVGLIAEIEEDAILANVDEDDADGDGISGRPNWDRGFVGRFGRKAQTVSIEGFIRGPLNNHLGITTNPLTPEQQASLPVPSVADLRETASPLSEAGGRRTVGQAQAAAPAEPLFDDDDAPDPEMSGDELFAVVSYAMLLAAPEPDPLTEVSARGRDVFREVQCAGCHVEALESPRGLIPLHSDLLLHDMGEELADGIAQGVATGAEFRTQPLWGIAPVGPYLHDGRAQTLDEAIRLHGGEASASRDAYAAATPDDRDALRAYLLSLGGADLMTDGLIPPNTPIARPGEPGAPTRALSEEEVDRFLTGRALFDHNFSVAEGLGGRMNGDSCRACHFDPVPGGSGPLGLNVIRHGTWQDGAFTAPDVGTILHRLVAPDVLRRASPQTGVNTFEFRQTPSLLGLGLLESVPAEEILALADPDDADQDGIRGVAHVLPDGRLGRFGWKAQVPSLREFTRDAMSAEVGLTVPDEEGLTFGVHADTDGATDPEVTLGEIDAMEFWLVLLDAPMPSAESPAGAAVFESVGCASCHRMELPGENGPVRAYTDLLLHDVAPAGYDGIPDGNAGPRHFRTPPLWGLGDTAPYMHDGLASTIDAAIRRHDTEAGPARDAYLALTDEDREALLEFLETR